MTMPYLGTSEITGSPRPTKLTHLQSCLAARQRQSPVLGDAPCRDQSRTMTSSILAHLATLRSLSYPMQSLLVSTVSRWMTGGHLPTLSHKGYTLATLWLWWYTSSDTFHNTRIRRRGLLTRRLAEGTTRSGSPDTRTRTKSL